MMSITDAELLDAVKEKSGKRSDVELAELLCVPRSVVSKARANRRRLSDYTRVVAFDLLGYEWAKMALKYAFYDDLKAKDKR
jgi:hypothetical protein